MTLTHMTHTYTHDINTHDTHTHTHTHDTHTHTLLQPATSSRIMRIYWWLAEVDNRIRPPLHRIGIMTELNNETVNVFLWFINREHNNIQLTRAAQTKSSKD